MFFLPFKSILLNACLYILLTFLLRALLYSAKKSTFKDSNCMIPRVVAVRARELSSSTGLHELFKNQQVPSINLPQPFTISRPKFYEPFLVSPQSTTWSSFTLEAPITFKDLYGGGHGLSSLSCQLIPVIKLLHINCSD